MTTALRSAAARALLLLAAAVLLVGLPASPAAASSAVLHVDQHHAGADDAGPGTPERPLRTITAAVRRAETLVNAGTSARVVVRPGVYRETVQPARGAQRTAATLTIEGDGSGPVVVSGADVWGGWQPADGIPGAFAAPWPHRWGLSAVPSGWPAVSDLLRRREMVFVNGALMRQVLSAGALVPGSFFVDEGAGRVVVLPPAGVDLGTAQVEMAVRPTVLEVDGWSGVTVRRMTFRAAASGVQGNAGRIVNARDVLLEDVTFEWGNWGGIGVLASERATLRRVAATDNGVVGMGGWRVRTLLVEDSLNARNNWRGDWAGFYGWDTGSKFMGLRGAVFRRHRGVDNMAHGLWLDTDNVDVRVEDSFLAGNWGNGLYVEANQGPIEISGSVFCANRHAGVLNAQTDRVTLQRSTMHSNGRAQLMLSGVPGGRTFTSWEGASVNANSRHWTVLGNTVVGGTGGWLVDVTWPEADFATMTATLASGGNHWYHADRPNGFQLPGGSRVNLTGWQQRTGQDLDSTGSAVATPPCAPPVASSVPSPPQPAPTTNPEAPAPQPAPAPAPAPASEPAPEPSPAPTTSPTGGGSRQPPGRVAGRSRIHTALELSSLTPGTGRAVVLARADDYGDALAGAPLAARLEAPILLSGAQQLDATTAGRIRELRPDVVYLLGGRAALSTELEAEVAALPGVGRVRRLSGPNRFATAAAVAAEVGGTTAYLAEGGRGWPDAVSASALAALEGRPVLLTAADALPAPTADAIAAQGITRVVVVGGLAVISDAVVEELTRRGVAVERVAGRDRYATSTLVADRAVAAGADVSEVWTATGRSFADALSAGPVVGARRGVLLLVDGQTAGPGAPAMAWLEARRGQVRHLVVVGGQGAVSEAIEAALRARVA